MVVSRFWGLGINSNTQNHRARIISTLKGDYKDEEMWGGNVSCGNTVGEGWCGWIGEEVYFSGWIFYCNRWLCWELASGEECDILGKRQQKKPQCMERSQKVHGIEMQFYENKSNQREKRKKQTKKLNKTSLTCRIEQGSRQIVRVSICSFSSDRYC